jgi:hypothetical protein
MDGDGGGGGTPCDRAAEAVVKQSNNGANKNTRCEKRAFMGADLSKFRPRGK